MLRILDRRPLNLLLALGVGACSGAGWGRADYGAVFDQVVFGGEPEAPAAVARLVSGLPLGRGAGADGCR